MIHNGPEYMPVFLASHTFGLLIVFGHVHVIVRTVPALRAAAGASF